MIILIHMNTLYIYSNISSNTCPWCCSTVRPVCRRTSMRPFWWVAWARPWNASEERRRRGPVDVVGPIVPKKGGGNHRKVHWKSRDIMGISWEYHGDVTRIIILYVLSNTSARIWWNFDELSRWQCGKPNHELSILERSYNPCQKGGGYCILGIPPQFAS